jgi:hypothetical protein
MCLTGISLCGTNKSQQAHLLVLAHRRVHHALFQKNEVEGSHLMLCKINTYLAEKKHLNLAKPVSLGAREGELADVRRRCRTRQHVSRRRAEAVRQDATQQLAGANEEGGSRIDGRGGCVTKGNVRRRWRDKRRRDNKPANRGKRDEIR